MLSLLYGYQGQVSAGLVLERLGAIVAGALIGAAGTGLFLPLHSRDVVRVRMSEALSVIAELLDELRGGCPDDPAKLADLARQDHRLTFAAGRLERVRRPVDLRRQLARWIRSDRPQLADAADAVVAAIGSARALGQLRLVPAWAATAVSDSAQLVRGNVTTARMVLADRPAPQYAALTGPLEGPDDDQRTAVLRALAAIDAAVRVVVQLRPASLP